MAARRCRGEAPERLRVLKVLRISGVRRRPSIALILAKPSSPIVNFRGFERLPAFDLFLTFFMESL